MRNFAGELHWTPNYEVQGSFGVAPAASHLIVEHGLENTATISFLSSPFRAADLAPDQLRVLLAVSYNNLVEWHLFVSGNDVRWVNNLADRATDSLADQVHPIGPSGFVQYLSADRLDELADFERSRRSLKPCDEALLQVISRWKRLLKADYPAVENSNISALFNALILIRGCEDRDLDKPSGSRRLLLQCANDSHGESVELVELLQHSLERTGVDTPLSDYVTIESLAPLRLLDRATALNLFSELYAPREAAYDLISH